MPVKRRLLRDPIAPVQFVQPRLLRIPQAAVYLGCSVWCVRDLLRRHELPKIQLGKKFLIDRVDLDKYVERAKE